MDLEAAYQEFIERFPGPIRQGRPGLVALEVGSQGAPAPILLWSRASRSGSFRSPEHRLVQKKMIDYLLGRFMTSPPAGGFKSVDGLLSECSARHRAKVLPRSAACPTPLSTSCSRTPCSRKSLGPRYLLCWSRCAGSRDRTVSVHTASTCVMRLDDRLNHLQFPGHVWDSAGSHRSGGTYEPLSVLRLLRSRSASWHSRIPPDLTGWVTPPSTAQDAVKSLRATLADRFRRPRRCRQCAAEAFGAAEAVGQVNRPTYEARRKLQILKTGSPGASRPLTTQSLHNADDEYPSGGAGDA